MNLLKSFMKPKIAARVSTIDKCLIFSYTKIEKVMIHTMS